MPVHWLNPHRSGEEDGAGVVQGGPGCQMDWCCHWGVFKVVQDGDGMEWFRSRRGQGRCSRPLPYLNTGPGPKAYMGLLSSVSA